MKRTEHAVTLKDYMDKGHAVACRVGLSDQGIEIFFDGYGVSTMEPGHGAPIFIELDVEGVPTLYVWADVNNEDPTHKISLAGAREGDYSEYRSRLQVGLKKPRQRG